MFRDTNPIHEFRGPFGVPVQIGASLILLVLFYGAMSGGSPLWTLGFIGMLILSIFLHELGHAWACLIQGIPVRRVMLYGGGGFCERAHPATVYQQEFIVAMGPIVNLVLWGVFSLISDGMWAWIIADARLLEDPSIVFTSTRADIALLCQSFAYVNGFLALFNLIPVQPLDGGKLLQLVLLRLTNPETALRVSGGIGLVLSVLWIPGMLLIYGMGWWILFFIPSIPLHWAMVRGQLA